MADLDGVLSSLRGVGPGTRALVESRLSASAQMVPLHAGNTRQVSIFG